MITVVKHPFDIVNRRIQIVKKKPHVKLCKIAYRETILKISTNTITATN